MLYNRVGMLEVTVQKLIKRSLKHFNKNKSPITGI